MRRALLLLSASFALLAAPAVGRAGVASLETRDLPLGPSRSLAAAAPAAPFQLVGIQWRGSGSLEVRTRSVAGRWSAWRAMDAEDADRPDAGSREARAAATTWRTSAPVWVRSADRVEVRRVGRVLRARALLVRSPVVKVPLRLAAAAAAPAIVPRSGWLADEAIRRNQPDYADALRMAHVHHTAGGNTYTRLEAPAVVRGIQLYHVKANGWNDIGYNALVDRFGTVYEGRYGGIDRNVVGAHAMGFNTGSFGIAVLGDFQKTAPPRAAVDALVRTLAWRLDTGHVDPLATFNGISAGNERFTSGAPVFLRVISGHRDTGLTACPGEKLYELIPEIARRVAATGLPKLYTPLAERAESGGVRFTARLSSALPWTAVVVDAAGVELGRSQGRGPAVDWTWDPPGPIPAGATWRIDAPGATPASGALAPTAAAALAIAQVSASPATISPNGDGQADATEIAFTLSADANVSATVLDAGGMPLVELERLRWRRAGARTVAFDGAGLPDGAYVVRLEAHAAGGLQATVDVPVVVTRTLGRVTLSTASLTPNGDGNDDRLRVDLPLAAAASARVRVLRDGKWVATPFEGPVEPGTHSVEWDGRKRLGPARDGAYVVEVEVTDAIGVSRVELPVALDATRPVVRLLGGRPVKLWVSEPSRLAVTVNGARRTLEAASRGAVVLAGIERVRTLVVVASDAAGNTGTLRRR